MAEHSTPAIRAYKALKQRILDLTYPPGERLSEVRLADDLGLGRSPIRTALARLKNDGWISVSPKSGTYVRSLSDKEIDDLLDLRLLLETHVARAAAGRISDAKLRELRRAYQRVCPHGVDALDEDSFDEFNELDSLFHITLYRAAGNDMITEILVNLVDKIQWIKTSAPTSAKRIKSALVELRRLLEALEARDAQTAAARMGEHIRAAAVYAAQARSDLHRAPFDADSTDDDRTTAAREAE